MARSMLLFVDAYKVRVKMLKTLEKAACEVEWESERLGLEFEGRRVSFVESVLGWRR